jgi:XTP/dITP diphosphohydrolase
MRIFIASSNPGKLREFAEMAAPCGVAMELLPRFRHLPEAIEDGETFEENARKKSVHYSRFAPGELVLVDDSGLSVDALHGEPGVHSARYAASGTGSGNSGDEDNNAKLLRELSGVAMAERTARYVCVVSVARDGCEIAHFRGESEGVIHDEARGSGGFGYDPYFYVPALQKTYAELSPEEKASISHRGAAFRLLLQWCRLHPEGI